MAKAPTHPGQSDPRQGRQGNPLNGMKGLISRWIQVQRCVQDVELITSKETGDPDARHDVKESTHKTILNGNTYRSCRQDDDLDFPGDLDSHQLREHDRLPAPCVWTCGVRKRRTTPTRQMLVGTGRKQQTHKSPPLCCQASPFVNRRIWKGRTDRKKERKNG